MADESILSRREVLGMGAAGGAALLLAGCAGGTAQTTQPSRPTAAPAGEPRQETTANEDLMREHGVIRRIFLVYEEAFRLTDNNPELAAVSITAATQIMQKFGSNYHERMEEQYVFPVLERSKQHVETLRTLRRQHEVGRALLAHVLAHGEATISDRRSRSAVARMLWEYIHMYQPHAAREDTVIFPAFKAAVSEPEYRGLGDQFEKDEQVKLGPNGYERTLAEVVDLENALGIHDLAKFTPAMPGK